MSDLSLTATAVVKGAGASIDNTHVFGETVTAGQGVYLAADNKYYKAVSASGGTALASGAGTTLGIALNGGAVNQPAFVQTDGLVTIGATIAVGVFYYVSNTAGGICAVADLGAADFVSVLGYGSTTALLKVQPIATGLILA